MIKKVVFLFSFLLVLSQLFGQEKTALVLSGGGSRAVAHIGVIRALEEHHIKIDYIVGSSMGAMIGAMYASGMSPDEMEKYFLTNDVESWVNLDNDPMQRYYFLEDDPDASIVQLGFKFKNNGFKYNLPTHIISGNRLSFELMKMLSGSCVAAHNNFDSLMIPYRCIATDIDKGNIVVLKNGSLSGAVRASMTFPFLIDPITLNGKLLFDGGMKNNFPVDIAIEEFNPDFIIGSKAAGNYDAPEDDDLMSIIQNLLATDVEFTTHGKKGFVLEMDLPSLDIIDFTQSSSLIDSGYKQAHHFLHLNFMNDSLPIETEDLSAKRQAFLSKKPSFEVDVISTEMAKGKEELYTKRIVKRSRPLKDFNDLEKDFFRIAANPGFRKINADMVYDYTKKSYDLVYHLKKNDPFKVDFGGNISSSNLTQAYLKLSYQKVGTNRFSSYLNGYFGQFYRSIKGSARFDISGVLPFSINLSATYNHKNYFRGKTYFFEDENPAFLKEDERFFKAEFSVPEKNFGKSTVGIEIGSTSYSYYQNNSFSRLDTSDNTIFEYLSPFINYEINTLNKKQFANRGLLLVASFRFVDGLEKHMPGSTSDQIRSSGYFSYSALSSFYRFTFYYENYFFHLNKLHLGIKLETVLSNQAFLNNYTASILSAEQFSPTTESQALFLPNYRAYNYGAAGIVSCFDIMQRLSFRVEAFYYQPYQRIKADEQNKAVFESKLSSRFFIGSSSFIYETRLGPASISANYYNGVTDPWSFIFSFGYVLFNKMSIE